LDAGQFDLILAVILEWFDIVNVHGRMKISKDWSEQIEQIKTSYANMRKFKIIDKILTAVDYEEIVPKVRARFENAICWLLR
jgi:hypothetical protein